MMASLITKYSFNLVVFEVQFESINLEILGYHPLLWSYNIYGDISCLKNRIKLYSIIQITT
jgi:hypothetical protein